MEQGIDELEFICESVEEFYKGKSVDDNVIQAEIIGWFVSNLFYDIHVRYDFRPDKNDVRTIIQNYNVEEKIGHVPTDDVFLDQVLEFFDKYINIRCENDEQHDINMRKAKVLMKKEFDFIPTMDELHAFMEKNKIVHVSDVELLDFIYDIVEE
jgi:hypothetical protein